MECWINFPFLTLAKTTNQSLSPSTKLCMDFEDPLRGYRVLRRPSPDTDISSVPASLKEYEDRQDEVEVILDGYVPTQESDDIPCAITHIGSGD